MMIVGWQEFFYGRAASRCRIPRDASTGGPQCPGDSLCSIETCEVSHLSWDEQKDAANRRKHAVDFADASTVFGDPLSITVADPDHAPEEDRFVIIGVSRKRELAGCSPYCKGSANPPDQCPQSDES